MAGVRYLLTRKRLDGGINTWEIDANAQQRLGSVAQTLNASFAAAPGAVYQAAGTPLARTIGHVARAANGKSAGARQRLHTWASTLASMNTTIPAPLA
ncbi:MAG: hypothetical protein M3O74_19475 [Pseudomonadota bacterium]|nr:hypothetical protein [Pseudomonadota bacterium]